MKNTYLNTPEGLAAAQRFGSFIRLWFNSNAWAQEIAATWAETNDETGPHASQISNLMNAKAEPKPHFFRQLHKFNLAVAEDRPGPMPSDKAALIIFGDALRRQDGTPLSTGDFLELYLGLQEPNFIRLCAKHRKPLS